VILTQWAKEIPLLGTANSLLTRSIRYFTPKYRGYSDPECLNHIWESTAQKPSSRGSLANRALAVGGKLLGWMYMFVGLLLFFNLIRRWRQYRKLRSIVNSSRRVIKLDKNNIPTNKYAFPVYTKGSLGTVIEH